jgi:DNA invertase Pin-like site-specific DNA recombinase
MSERTVAGLQRAKARGQVGGRPKAQGADPELPPRVIKLRKAGMSIRGIASKVRKSVNTVQRHPEM